MAVTLVLRALGLGDLLTAVPALRALRRARPHDRIVLAAPGALAPLVEPLDAVDELLPTRGLGALRAPPGPDRPDLAVNLHGRGPESIADLLATRPARLLSHRHPAFPAVDGPDWTGHTHEVHRWCALLDGYGIDADPDDLLLARPDTPAPVSGAVVVHPGAASAARRWPARRFAAVARTLAADLTDHTGPARVVVTAGPGERELATTVAAGAGLGPDAVVTTDLAATAALVADAALVICGDTGIGHLATAFGTPSVLLFGPTPPDRWGPPPRPRHRVLWAGTTGDPHADTPDPGLLRLSVPRVVRTARTLLFGGEPCQHTPVRAARTPRQADSRSGSSAPATSD